MKPAEFRPAFEQKTVHILVRWLILAIAFHFLASSRVSTQEFPVAIRIVYAFIVTNLVLMVLPARWFSSGLFFRWLLGMDLGFVGLCLYFLREPYTYYHWLYILLLGVLFWRNNLQGALTSLAAGLAMLSLVGWVLRGRWQFFSDTGDFLQTTILLATGGFYFFVMDLLDRNATLFQTVERGKKEWERTADAMSEWVLLVDPEGRIRRVNRPLADQLGQKPAQLVGQPWFAVLDGAAAPPPECPLAQMFQRRTLVEAAYAHAKLPGAARATAIPLSDADGAAGGAIYVLRPTTKQ